MSKEEKVACKECIFSNTSNLEKLKNEIKKEILNDLVNNLKSIFISLS